MGSLIVRWALLCGLLTLVLCVMAQLHSQPADMPLILFLAANAALSLLCLGDVIKRRSPWVAYWGPLLLAEAGRWLFDLFWIGLFAGLVLEIVPHLIPALILVPPVSATALLVSRFRANLATARRPLPLWV